MDEIQAANSQTILYRLLTPGGKDMLIANAFIAIFAPAVDSFEAAIRRTECAENMQRLALAILLYQIEHGKMPDEHWTMQIEKYLGENPERYFSCPANPTPQGETRYAMIQYGDATGDTVAGSLDTLLLVELPEAVPLDKAVITVDEIVEWTRGETIQETYECCGKTHVVNRVINRIKAHPGGINAAYRSGTVRFVSSTIEEAELLRLLGRE